MKKLSQLLDKPGHQLLQTVATQLHHLCLPIHLVVNHTIILCHLLCHELLYPLIYIRIPNLYYLLYRNHLPVIRICRTHRYQVFLIIRKKHLLVMRLNSILRILSKKVSLLQLFQCCLPSQLLLLLLYLLRRDERNRDRLVFHLIFHILEINLVSIEPTCVVPHFIIAFSQSISKNY